MVIRLDRQVVIPVLNEAQDAFLGVGDWDLDRLPFRLGQLDLLLKYVHGDECKIVSMLVECNECMWSLCHIHSIL